MRRNVATPNSLVHNHASWFVCIQTPPAENDGGLRRKCFTHIDAFSDANTHVQNMVGLHHARLQESHARDMNEAPSPHQK